MVEEADWAVSVVGATVGLVRKGGVTGEGREVGDRLAARSPQGTRW